MAVLRNKGSYQKCIYDFMNTVYIICPSCSKQAIVRNYGLSSKNKEDKIKLTCTNCGCNKNIEEKPLSVLYVDSNKEIKGRLQIIGKPVDPYFHMPLWLTVNCSDNILWAYNYEHLNFIKKHIEAKLRERDTEKMVNKSLGSRLPKWMTAKKNREAILKAINQLKKNKS